MEDAPLSPGLLLVLSAPSGAGKTTLAHRVLREFPQTILSVSSTTRSPRGQERDGVDYHFVDAKTFQDRIERGDFVEWAEVHGHFYGSPKSVIDEAFARQSLAVFDIDVQGGQAIKRKYPDAMLTFILPPSLEELERRLRGRGTDSDDTIRKRMLAARAEIEKGEGSYDFIIVNDHVDNAFDQLRAIVLAERCRRGRVDLSKLPL
jgi:guanylate kinase